MAVTVYQDTDGSAPILDNTTDSLALVIKACLVDGYGAKSPLSWAVPFSASGKYVFRAGSGLRQYFRLSHGGGNYQLGAFESMSDVDTGTDMWCSTSNTPGQPPDTSASRKWIIVADEKTCHVFWETSVGSGDYSFFSMGDAHPYGGSDVWHAYAWLMPQNTFLTTSPADTAGSAAVMRSWDGVIKGATGSPPLKATLWTSRAWGNFASSAGVMPYPNTADGKSYLTPVRMGQNNEPVMRGTLRGLWIWLHPLTAIADRDTFSGQAGSTVAGKTFLAIRRLNHIPGGGEAGGADQGGALIVETSNTWPS